MQLHLWLCDCRLTVTKLKCGGTNFQKFLTDYNICLGRSFVCLILFIAKKLELVDNFGFFGGKLHVFNRKFLEHSFLTYPLLENLLNLFIRVDPFLGCHINHAITKALRLLKTS